MRATLLLNTITLRWVVQPIISLSSGEGVDKRLCAEVLLRPEMSDKTQVRVDQFIIDCERDGRVLWVDQWVLLSVSRWLSEYRDAWSRIDFISTNVSAITLSDPQSAQSLMHDLLLLDPLLLPKLCIEITETARIENIDYVRNWLAQARAAGIRVALDDLGDGHANIQMMQELWPLDIIKISGRWTRQALNDSTLKKRIERIVEHAQSKGALCVIESLESDEQIAWARDCGARYAQGFGLARPMPAEQWLLE